MAIDEPKWVIRIDMETALTVQKRVLECQSVISAMRKLCPHPDGFEMVEQHPDGNGGVMVVMECPYCLLERNVPWSKKKTTTDELKPFVDPPATPPPMEPKPKKKKKKVVTTPKPKKKRYAPKKIAWAENIETLPLKDSPLCPKYLKQQKELKK